MKNLEFLAAAYIVIWVFIGGYIFRLGGKLKEIGEKLEQLEIEIKK